MHTATLPRSTLHAPAQAGRFLGWGLFVAALAFFNPHLWGGSVTEEWTFLPHQFFQGAWWRLLTHPFVHVSWYHLVLDASAFVLLYTRLEAHRACTRLVAVFICMLGSVTLPLVSTDAVSALGLCGLSGTAHGLMTIVCLDLVCSKARLERVVGSVNLALLVLKSGYEYYCGTVLFAWLHLGPIGTPIAACHAGGVLAGILAWLVFRLVRPLKGQPEHEAERCGCR
jgi:rhomboid family GlyGly-CTERM serine protease